jgi:hypothetical protein
MALAAYSYVTIPDAQATVLAHTPRPGSELVELGAAAGRIVAETVRAADDLPPFPASIKVPLRAAAPDMAPLGGPLATLPRARATDGAGARAGRLRGGRGRRPRRLPGAGRVQGGQEGRHPGGARLGGLHHHRRAAAAAPQHTHTPTLPLPPAGRPLLQPAGRIAPHCRRRRRSSPG